MELSPSSVALTFNLWPLNIYQLLNWLCTIIPSSISQIHHFDLSSQFQVTCTIPTDAVILSQKLELKPCCSTMSSVRKSQKHLSLEATCGRRGVGCQSSWQCDEAGAEWPWAHVLALVNPEPLWGCFGISCLFNSQSWEEYFGNHFRSFACLKSTLLWFTLCFGKYYFLNSSQVCKAADT